MLAFIFTVLFSSLVAYFATQNTGTVTLYFASYVWTGIPLYLVILGALVTGLVFAWVFHLLFLISSTLTISGKNHALKALKQENLELTKKVHQLELENAKFTTRDGDSATVDNNSL
ncbi:MAG TPA: lipopolysaccharide assembly protein LapA domain-containing protein [Patescibacteria group bacterium]|nr:lipopolysaccharide assembly protein LapA domain-containing protein [Patescibacteria group bacterium]